MEGRKGYEKKSVFSIGNSKGRKSNYFGSSREYNGDIDEGIVYHIRVGW